MISKKMEKLVAGSSVIRAMFEEGKQMAAKVGAENVYDLYRTRSLGQRRNPPLQQITKNQPRADFLICSTLFSDQTGLPQEDKNSRQKQTQKRIDHDPFRLFRFIEGTILPAGTVFGLRIKLFKISVPQHQPLILHENIKQFA